MAMMEAKSWEVTSREAAGGRAGRGPTLGLQGEEAGWWGTKKWGGPGAKLWNKMGQWCPFSQAARVTGWNAHQKAGLLTPWAHQLRMAGRRQKGCSEWAGSYSPETNKFRWEGPWTSLFFPFRLWARPSPKALAVHVPQRRHGCGSGGQCSFSSPGTSSTARATGALWWSLASLKHSSLYLSVQGLPVPPAQATLSTRSSWEHGTQSNDVFLCNFQRYEPLSPGLCNLLRSAYCVMNQIWICILSLSTYPILYSLAMDQENETSLNSTG